MGNRGRLYVGAGCQALLALIDEQPDAEQLLDCIIVQVAGEAQPLRIARIGQPPPGIRQLRLDALAFGDV
jgi:hypothetical protein